MVRDREVKWEEVTVIQGYEPKNVNSLWKLKKTRNGSFARASTRNTALMKP